MSDSSGKTNYK